MWPPMGLLYSKLYIDFDPGQWEQVANDPVSFRTRAEGITLDVEDTSHKPYRLVFKEGGRVSIMRVTGKYRILWDDDDASVQRQ